jgi:N utilization substance protein A
MYYFSCTIIFKTSDKAITQPVLKQLTAYIIDQKDKHAIAVAEGDNLSLAIGRNGQNVKLAAKLTKCKIDVKTLVQVQEEGINIYKYYEA